MHLCLLCSASIFHVRRDMLLDAFKFHHLVHCSSIVELYFRVPTLPTKYAKVWAQTLYFRKITNDTLNYYWRNKCAESMVLAEHASS